MYVACFYFLYILLDVTLLLDSDCDNCEMACCHFQNITPCWPQEPDVKKRKFVEVSEHIQLTARSQTTSFQRIKTASMKDQP
jgi:hypothetical protein